jgi:hypothetical protein
MTLKYFFIVFGNYNIQQQQHLVLRDLVQIPLCRGYQLAFSQRNERKRERRERERERERERGRKRKSKREERERERDRGRKRKIKRERERERKRERERVREREREREIKERYVTLTQASIGFLGAKAADFCVGKMSINQRTK